MKLNYEIMTEPYCRKIDLGNAMFSTQYSKRDIIIPLIPNAAGTAAALVFQKIIVKLYGFYNSTNYYGCLEKIFILHARQTGLMATTEGRYITNIGYTSHAFSIGDAIVDTTNWLVKIPIEYNAASASSNSCYVSITGYSSDVKSIGALSLAYLSDVYDTSGQSDTAFTRPSRMLDQSYMTTAGDFNDYKKPGFYLQSAMPTGANKPDAQGGILMVFAAHNNNMINQIYYRYDGKAAYSRGCYNGTWTAWSCIGSTVEGTWTPVMTTKENHNPTVTYTKQQGYYYRIGNMVYISFYCSGKITSLSGITNNYAAIKGLPIKPKTMQIGSMLIATGAIYHCFNSDPTVIKMNINNAYNGSIYLDNSAGVGSVSWRTSDDFQLGGSGWYIAA